MAQALQFPREFFVWTDEMGGTKFVNLVTHS